MYRIIILTLVLAVSACGNNKKNRPPVIEPVGDASISANQTDDSISIRVSDDKNRVEDLSIQISSSDENLLPQANIQLSDFINGEAQLRLTPISNLIGSTSITIQVTDTGGLSDSVSFNLDVVNQQLSANTLIRETFAEDANSEPRLIDVIDVIDDVTDENAFDDLIER